MMKIYRPTDNEYKYRLAFEGEREVEVVGAAFSEYVYSKELGGNSSSISQFDERLAFWPTEKKTLPVLTNSPDNITSKLYLLSDHTDEVVAEMSEYVTSVASPGHARLRLQGVTWRYNLGQRAHILADLIELKVSEHSCEDAVETDFDAEFAHILRPQPE